MPKYKIYFIKFIILIGQNTFFGRGKIRSILIKLINLLISTSKINLLKPLFKINFFDFEIYFYGDKKTGIKLYFQRNEIKEITFLKKNITNKSWFIDIGSNIGIYTLNIANLNTYFKKIKILSIEPNPEIFKRLKENINLLKKNNKFSKNRIFTENIAIGDKKQFVYLDTSPNHANSKIYNIKKSKNKNFLKVKMNYIYNLIKKYDIKNIYCIKIDTEGYEKNILKNFFINAKKHHYPNIFIVEHNNKKDFININRFILKFGYEICFTTNSNTIYKLINEKS